MSVQLTKLESERNAIELKKKKIEAEIRQAADEFHQDFLQVDLNMVDKQILDWDLLHHQELINLPAKINALEKEYSTGLEKLKLSVQYSKYGIYRIQHFIHKLSFLAVMLIASLIFLFIYPFYLRYQMVLFESDLDIKLEGKTVDFIKSEYSNSNQEIKKLLAEFNSAEIPVENTDPFLPVVKFKSEKVALKNQLDTFLTNELV